MTFQRGDVTGSTAGVPDEKVDIVDVVYLNNHVANLSVVPNPFPIQDAPTRGDVTGSDAGVPDEKVDIVDVVYLNNHVANLSVVPNPFPLAPWPSTGIDSLFELKDIGNDKVELWMNTSKLVAPTELSEDPSYVPGCAGLQMYVLGVQLASIVEEPYYVSGKNVKISDWVIGSNTLEIGSPQGDISLIYLEGTIPQKLDNTFNGKLCELNVKPGTTVSNPAVKSGIAYYSFETFSFVSYTSVMCDVFNDTVYTLPNSAIQ